MASTGFVVFWVIITAIVIVYIISVGIDVVRNRTYETLVQTLILCVAIYGVVYVWWEVIL